MSRPKKQAESAPEAVSEEVKETTPEPIVTRDLNVAEKFYINQNKDALHVDEIASDLGLPVDLVKSEVARLNDTSTPKTDGMFERTLAKRKHGTGGAVIMTEGASERVDEAYQNQGPREDPKHVFRPKRNN